MMESAVFKRIKHEINSHDVVLYMNGMAAFPQCSCSALIVQVLSQAGVKFRDIDVMGDKELRQGLKDFTGWAYFPQLYVKGEFAGDANIIREMVRTGEFQNLFNKPCLKTCI